MAAEADDKTAESESRPKLSPYDFRQYNRIAENMDYFVSSAARVPDTNTTVVDMQQHNHFRETWTLMYKACENNKRPASMSIRQFLHTGLEFCNHLEMHHGIEERHVFPLLAKKMPAFRKELELLAQHKEIHQGLEKFREYLENCQSGEKELRLVEMRRLMDEFGDVLWRHLDEEVKELGAENMRKYWTLEEMRTLSL
jgi:hemerythrin-like domain-containing protein